MVRLPTWKEWPDGRAAPSELLALYSRGYQGAYRSEADNEEVADCLEFVSYRDVREEYKLDDFAGNIERHRGLYLPYLSVQELQPDAYDEAQETGDCVSFWARTHSDSVRAGDILSRGDAESWRTLGATEHIYGYRENYRPGMSCARAVGCLIAGGGMLLRAVYEFADLRYYNSELAIRWGRRKGLPDAVREKSQQHQIEDATVVDDLESVRVAFRCGYSVGGCSGLGLSARRDANGGSEASGSWAHAMWCGGYDERQQTLEAYGEGLVLFVNSWGNWNRGSTLIPGTVSHIPLGSCWVRESVVERRCLKGGGFYTLSGADGWAPITLPDLGATGEI